MLIIGRIPKEVYRFIRVFKEKFSKPAWYHFWGLLIAMAISNKPRKIVHLAKTRKKNRHRSRIGDFLANSKWNEAEILELSAFKVLQSMRPQRGETMYFVIDDTKQQKRGKLIAAVGRIYDHVLRKFTNGHTAIVAAIVFRGITLPLKIRLYIKKEDCPKYERGFATFPEMAAQIIRCFCAPVGLKVIVLFDSFYLCKKLTEACRQRGFTFISVAASNRRFIQQGRLHKIGKYVKNILGRSTQQIKVVGNKRIQTYTVAVRQGYLGKIGLVQLVASRRESDRNRLCLVTNDLKLTARQIIEHYEYRWCIEVLFKELKQYLGWGDYQVRKLEAVVRHLHLVALTHILLTHLGLTSLGAEAKKKNKELWLPSIPTLQSRLCQIVWKDIKEQLARAIKDPKVLSLVERHLGTLAA